MDCAAVKPRMEALVSGTLPESERTLAEQHIAMCEGCRLELELVRAIGSQEKPASGSKADWTLDRIFGSEGGAPVTENRDAIAPLPSEEAPSSPFASSDSEPPAQPHPALASSEDDEDSEKPHNGRKAVEATWSFEPADAAAAVKPPEESLFFATEALNRNRESERRPSNARVLLWGLGGVVGVGLLVFSAWFVLHLTPADEPMRVRPAPMTGGTDGTTDAPENTPPDMMEAPDDGSIQHESGEAPDNSAQAKPAGTPRVTASTTPQPMPLPTSATVGVDPVPPATKHVTTGTSTQAPSKAKAQTGTAADPFARGTSSKGQAGPTLAPGDARPTKTGPRVDAMGDPIPDDTDDSTPTPTSSNDFTVRSGHTTTPPRTAGRGSTMWQNHTPAPKPVEEAPPTAEPAADSPIDRMHVATVAAQEKGDVLGLRRLRTSWKAMIPKLVGPDRSRAKREYADCLWAIQIITGRSQDQKDTLAAYREYLLGAPAGGADSRSVSRLRQLEDALTERR